MKFSLVFLTLPLLFSGCMQEKASKISPKSKDTNHTKTSKQEIKTLQNISETEVLQVNDNLHDDSTLYVNNNGIKLTPSINQNNLAVEDTTVLDELALNIQNSMDMDVSGNEDLTTESIEVGDNWVPFTKKDEVLETAKEYLGVKYVWAANGPSSFDCSGYTKYVFNQNGITIPRYSGSQANVGMKVSFDELQEGDLVFFDTSKGFHKKVNHVGIYIGNDQFIHASSAQKRVTITSFSEKKFYKNRFLLGRRVINTDTSFASYNNLESVHTN